MILACRECNRSWRYPCEDCAAGFVEWHRAEMGHDVQVTERKVPQITAYRYQEPQPAFPAWMRKGTA